MNVFLKTLRSERLAAALAAVERALDYSPPEYAGTCACRMCRLGAAYLALATREAFGVLRGTGRAASEGLIRVLRPLAPGGPMTFWSNAKAAVSIAAADGEPVDDLDHLAGQPGDPVPASVGALLEVVSRVTRGEVEVTALSIAPVTADDDDDDTAADDTVPEAIARRAARLN